MMCPVLSSQVHSYITSPPCTRALPLTALETHFLPALGQVMAPLPLTMSISVPLRSFGMLRIYSWIFSSRMTKRVFAVLGKYPFYPYYKSQPVCPPATRSFHVVPTPKPLKAF